jgi:SAM-dependent methyltransferase
LAPTDVVRRAWSRHLSGSGIELGPGHSPFPLPISGAQVRYVDRWDPDTNRALFPELGPADFPCPDVVADFDRDGLAPVADASVDFVVASHVLEHVADPLRLLAEIHRVLRQGGVAILLVPDRRTTFDAGRPATPLEHLVAEHAAGVTEVSDEHIVEFVRAVSGDDASPADIDLHRRRSIHVHCWTEDEFVPVLEHAMSAMGHGWLFVEDLATGGPGSNGIEFGFVLRKVDGCGDVERFVADRQAWRDATDGNRPDVERLEARVAALESSTSWRITAPLRRVSGWLRQRRAP